MQTVVYIDGYNLYFGRLKTTPYKWLDLYKLFNQHILPFKAPESELVTVKYFTSDILAKFASHGESAHQAQAQYHKALNSPYSGTTEVFKGFYTAEDAKAIVYQEPPSKNDRVDIWRLEEKQTDVKMAVEIYRDCAKGNCQQVVVCTNDSDLEPPLKAIKADYPDVDIGVVIPRPDPRINNGRSANARLTKVADWYLPHIIDFALANSQFPNRVPCRRKDAIKPDYW